jgi:hypothetical protein
MANIENSDLLTFYRDYRESFIRLKEIEVRQSEQRIRFFIALVTAIVAFIGILNNESTSLFDSFSVAAIAIPILLIYGILTFSQVIWSSHVIHNLDVTKGVLDKLIKERDHIFKTRIDEADLRNDSKIIGLRNLKGTFAQYMYLTEGLLVVGYIFLIGLNLCPDKVFLISIFAVLGFTLTTILMFIWGKKIKNGTKVN